MGNPEMIFLFYNYIANINHLPLLDTSGLHKLFDSHSVQVRERAQGRHLGWARNRLHPLCTEGCWPKSKPQRSQSHQICQQGSTQRTHGYFCNYRLFSKDFKFMHLLSPMQSHIINALIIIIIRHYHVMNLSPVLESKDGTLITPWFKLIVDNFLPHWWGNLGLLQNCTEHDKIHRYWLFPIQLLNLLNKLIQT